MAPGGFPVVLTLEGRPCLVVGGGRVAHRKISTLLAAGASVTVVAPEIDPAIDDLPVAVHRRRYARSDLDGQFIVISATGDRSVEAAVFADGRATGVLVNAADDPVHCDFTLPAVVRRGPVTVAVSTGGTSPALATWVRDRVAGALPDDLETLAHEVTRARDAIRAAGVGTEGLPWHELLATLSSRLDRPAGELDAIVAAFVDRAVGQPVDRPADLGGTVTA